MVGNMEVRSHRKQTKTPNADSSRYWCLRQDTQLARNAPAIKLMHSHCSGAE